MKIKLLGKNLQRISALLEKYNWIDSGTDTPDLIVTYGGDGALLGAEREFPGVPKLPLRDAETAPTCAAHQPENVIRSFIDGKLALTELPRLTASADCGKLTGINDLLIHSAEFTSALRCRVFIDGELYASEVVGDGICFASVHGSTAYYRNIARGVFRVGVGLAFSNSTEAVNHLVLPETSEVTVEILRGPGLVMADNDPRKLQLEVGEKVTLCQNGRPALIWGLEGFMCQFCRARRHHLHSLNEKEY
ncbi:MAG: hypothetical protein IJW33_02235 [Lentisphaeria bacterium]|nr:hypothetical protein [Lentisphaeria bacterium]